MKPLKGTSAEETRKSMCYPPCYERYFLSGDIIQFSEIAKTILKDDIFSSRNNLFAKQIKVC